MKTPVEVLKPPAVAFDWAGIKVHIVDLLTLVALGFEYTVRLILAGVWMAGALPLCDRRAPDPGPCGFTYPRPRQRGTANTTLGRSGQSLGLCRLQRPADSRNEPTRSE